MPAPRLYISSEVAAQRGWSQDRVAQLRRGDSLVLVVADGAGGTAGGGDASAAVLDQVRQVRRGEVDWRAVLRRADAAIAARGGGRSTAVVVEVGRRGLRGASVGDSEAWLIGPRKITRLTAQQPRKPLLGAGDARPFAFRSPPLRDTLLLASDGLFGYAPPAEIARIARGSPLSALPRRLIARVRLPSGGLWDDVAVVLCRPAAQFCR